jgi:hypothetical protein
MDRIIAMLQMQCPTTEHATGDGHALTDLVAYAILVETFILYTDVTLHEDEMVVLIPSNSTPYPCCWHLCTS